MAVVILLIVGALSVILYTKTRRPKLTAVVNGFFGLVSLFVGQLISVGSLSEVNFFNTALSVISGIPGGILVAFLSFV